MLDPVCKKLPINGSTASNHTDFLQPENTKTAHLHVIIREGQWGQTFIALSF